MLGATSQVGFFLIPKLARHGFEIVALTRGPPPLTGDSCAGQGWRTYTPQELASSLAGAGRFDTAVCLAPLPALLPLLGDVARLGVSRVIAFGTTSCFYKTTSADRDEQRTMQELLTAEAALAGRCAALGMDWTLLRPTLVYGCGRDGNIASIARFVCRFRFFPLCQEGQGRRQPVHAADLAQACVDVLDNPRTHARAYNLSGGSTVTYRQMVEAVFRQLGRPILVLNVPTGLLRAAIRVARRLPRLRRLSVEMAARMGEDLCFDHQDATRDFGFAPRPFDLDDLATGGGSR